MILPDELRDAGRESRRSQRTRRKNHRRHHLGRRDGRDLCALEMNQWMGDNRRGHPLGKLLAVNRQCRASRHADLVGHSHDERAKPTHFFLQQADRVVELVATKRVAADQFSQAVGLVDGRRLHRPHLVQGDGHAHRGGLPRGLAARQAAADDVHLHVVASSSSALWTKSQASFAQINCRPCRLVIFSVRNGHAHLGHGSRTGLFHSVKSHFG